jgi:hypothetical protein
MTLSLTPFQRWTITRVPRRFRTIQVCPKDLRGALRQAGDLKMMALGINGATSESARLTGLP